MAYKTTWKLLPDVPTRCPVCQDKRTDAAAIHTHNLRCAQYGERSYPK